jgi:hypothetical protein
MNLIDSSFAPLDYPDGTTVENFIEFYQALSIPPEFAEERIKSVSHSFGTRSDDEGSCVWFHFLCKYIQVAESSEGNDPEVAHHSAADGAITYRQRIRLPQDDSSYIRSAFFLRRSTEGATLVVFGNTCATTRLRDFISCDKAWNDAVIEPFVLFEIIFEGLRSEVDKNMRNLHTVYRDMEYVIHLVYLMAEGSNG